MLWLAGGGKKSPWMAKMGGKAWLELVVGRGDARARGGGHTGLGVDGLWCLVVSAWMELVGCTVVGFMRGTA